MKNELDELLKHALTPIDEPDSRLNQSIINQVKGQERMKTRIWKRFPAAALIAVIILGCASATVFAVYQLSVRDVIERTEDKKLLDAFTGEDAILVNETQSYGGYDVTLLGTVSGKNISDYIGSSNGVPLEDRTYAVVAIAYSDGTLFPEVMSDPAFDKVSFFISLLIRDFNPVLNNASCFCATCQGFVEDGVLYYVAECDNVEIFADHGLYLCVCDGPFYNSEAYQFDEATGAISRKEDYDGLNALFDLPIDPSKADPEAVKAFLKDTWYGEVAGGLVLEGEEDGTKQDSESGNFMDKNKWLAQLITPENINLYADCLEDSVQTLTPDEEGFIHYQYEGTEGSIADGRANVAGLFEKGEKFIIKGIGVSGSSEDGEAGSAFVNTLQANEDGTVTYACYRVKQSVLENK